MIFKIFAILVLSSTPLLAKTLYVDSSAKEEGSGSALRPYRLIQKALNRAQQGVTIKIAKGTYNELLTVISSGSKDAPIIVESWKNEKPNISGRYFDNETNKALLSISNASHVHFKNLKFTDFHASDHNKQVYGVWIDGAGENIQFNNCELTKLGSKGAPSMNSHAVLVTGRNDRRSLNNIQFRSLKIHDCHGLGSLLSIKGNVENGLLESSQLQNSDSLGLELIGNAGIASSSLVDMPRNFIIRRNYLKSLHRKRMLSTGGFRSAKAIFIDGAENIIVENNRVHNCDLGVELTSTKKGLGLNNMTIRNNWIQENESVGLVVGGSVYQTGRTENIRITNNTLIENDQANLNFGEVHFRYHVTDCAVKNNLIIPKSHADGALYLSQISKKQTPDKLVISNNFYVKRGEKAVWKIGFRDSVGYSNWLTRNFDHASQWGDLLFDENGIPHTLVQIRDKGDLRVSQSAEDIDGNPRILSKGLDIGAKEW